MAKWQNQKGAEIEETFRNSLTYNIVDDKVIVDVNLEVVFTKNFTKGDVYQWVEGLDRLVKAHSMIQMEKIMGRKEKPFDEELSKGPFFVFFNTSDPKSPYQFCYESNQFMDKNDHSLI